MDFCLLALYLASYSLRFAALYRVELAERRFNATRRAQDALEKQNIQMFYTIVNETRDPTAFPHSYFMTACE